MWGAGDKVIYLKNSLTWEFSVKVKNDHRSKFPDVSNWKEEA